MSEKVDYVKVTVSLPKLVVDFIKKFTDLVGDDLNKFVECALVSEINNMLANEEIFSTPWTCTMKVIEKNSLRPFIDESYLKCAKNDC